MSDVVRRKWDTAKSAPPPTTSFSTAPLPAPTKLLSARQGKLAFDQLVGKHALVQAGTSPASGQTQAGFYCSLCDRLLKDSTSYLDHLNSPYHLKLAGHKLEIKRATLHDVRARLAMHKRRRLESASLGEYDLDKRVELIKAQQDAERAARKERKRQRKQAEQMAREAGGGAVGRRKRLKLPASNSDQGVFEEESQSSDASGGLGSESGSEYSDYEIDEHGNIIESDAPVKKKRRVVVEEVTTEPVGASDEVSPEDVAAMMGFGSFGGSSKP